MEKNFGDQTTTKQQHSRTYRVVKKGEQYGFWLVFVDENDIVKIDEKPESVYASSMEGLEEKFDLIKDAW